MASKVSKICLVLLVLAIASNWEEAGAQSSSSACTSMLISMSSCLNYLSGNTSNPASSCCSALSNVVQQQPQCLCTVLNSDAASSLGVSLNQTRALQLPNVCNVQTPPVTKCNGAGTGGTATAGAPTDSPAGQSKEEPEAPSADFPSGSGSKTVPGSANDGSIVKSSLRVLGLVISVMFCTSVLAIF